MGVQFAQPLGFDDLIGKTCGCMLVCTSEDLITLFLEDSVPRHVLAMTSLTKLLELVGSNGGDDPWRTSEFEATVFKSRSSTATLTYYFHIFSNLCLR